MCAYTPRCLKILRDFDESNNSMALLERFAVRAIESCISDIAGVWFCTYSSWWYGHRKRA